nr:hypothetical protein BaRGS_007752 [Batillaria attramentaria]
MGLLNKMSVFWNATVLEGLGVCQIVERTEVYKYPGTSIDSEVTFAENTESILKKVQSRLYMVRKLRSFGVSKIGQLRLTVAALSARLGEHREPSTAVTTRKQPKAGGRQRALADAIQTPLKYIFIAMAIPLTLCNVIVFSQKDMRSASGTYVVGLNAGQLFYIVSNTADVIWAQFVDPPYSQYSFCTYEYYVAIYGGVLVAKRASYAILCLASVERLYAVVRPLHVKNFVLSKHPVIGVLSVYAFSATWHVFYVVKYRIEMMNIAALGYSVCRFFKTELYLSHKDVNDAFGLAA